MDGWLAVISGNDSGFAIVLNKRHRTFEDALAEANEVLSRGQCQQESDSHARRLGAAS